MQGVRLSTITDNDIQHLTQLRSLEQLILHQFPRISEMSFEYFAQMAALRALELHECNGITMLGKLGECTQLRSLFFSSQSYLQVSAYDAIMLSEIPRLKALVLLATPCAECLSFFARLTKLRVLITNWGSAVVTTKQFQTLTALQRVEEIDLPRVERVSDVLPIVTQLRSLRRVTFRNELTPQEMDTLRTALPHLSAVKLVPRVIYA